MKTLLTEGRRLALSKLSADFSKILLAAGMAGQLFWKLSMGPKTLFVVSILACAILALVSAPEKGG